MIDNDTLLGYALNALEPAEQERVRVQLLSDTAASVSLSRIQAILKPLEADREHPAPPGDLVGSTLARLDASLARPGAARGFAIGRWLEVALAASIGLVAFGLVVTGVNKVQSDNRIATCKNNLRQVSTCLHHYADAHNHNFPKVGGAEAPTAGHFHPVLADGGHWTEGLSPRCAGTEPIGYAYALGHRGTDGALIGPSRNCVNLGQMPIAGDVPSRAVNKDGPVSPHGRGQNVLFVDGHVIYSLTPTVGPNGDHIYLNDKGEPHAGLHANDAVLGRPRDVP